MSNKKQILRKKQYIELGNIFNEIKPYLRVSNVYEKKISNNDSLLCMIIEMKNLILLKHTSVNQNDLAVINETTLNGFTIVFTMDGSLLYISDNVHSFLQLTPYEIMLAYETIYGAVDVDDGEKIRNILRSGNRVEPFYVNFTATKRKSKHKENKIIKIDGYFSENKDLFIARCIPILTPKNRKMLITSSALCFTSVHSLDLKFKEICQSGKNILGDCLENETLFSFIHIDSLSQLRDVHAKIIQHKKQDGFVISAKMTRQDSTTTLLINCLINMYYKNISGQEYIVCNYQTFSDNEMKNLIDYYSKNTHYFETYFKLESLIEQTTVVMMEYDEYAIATSSYRASSTCKFIKPALDIDINKLYEELTNEIIDEEPMRVMNLPVKSKY